MMIVINSLPACDRAHHAIAHAATAAETPAAENLVAVLEVVDHVEDGIVVVDLDNLAVGKDQRHALEEAVPFFGSPEIVEHQEAAAEQGIAKLGGHIGGELPVAHFAGAHPWPVEDIVAVFEVDGLFDGAGMHAGESPHGLREMAVGARIILGPTGETLAPIAAATAPAAAPAGSGGKSVGMGRIHQAGQNPFGGVLVNRGE